MKVFVYVAFFVLKQPMAILINLSLQQGIFPETLKLQEWLIFLKKKIFKFISSVLLVFSKLFIKMCLIPAYVFLAIYKLLFIKQIGFRNNHSTSHTLISLTDLIKKYLDKDYFVFGVFIDRKNAFDTANH